MAVAVVAMVAGVAGAADIDYATARLSRKLPAARITSPIVIDGVLDEEAWQQAPVATDFIDNDSDTVVPREDRTEARIVYDDTTLYVGVKNFDREPGRIAVAELKKDFSSSASDGLCIILDTFSDHRNGYLFAVNPGGAQWDAQQTSEGRELNPSWDGIWTARARIVSDGWVAEFAIPFRTLRFPQTSPQTWGLNILRRVPRRGEDSLWAPVPRMYSINRVSLAGTLEGLTGVRPGRNLRVKPYGLSSLAQVGPGPGKGDADGGFDVKYGVTGAMTLDLTVNTDFSQVEADEQQINLTRFSLQFPEKRDFFMENSGVFVFGPGSTGPRGLATAGFDNVASGGVVGGRQNLRDPVLFFSRRIGLKEETGQAIPIVAGARLTGRAGPYTLGMLNLQQRAEGPTGTTNFTAIRVRRDVLRNSDVGAIVLNRDERGPRFNRVIGADANLRLRDLIANALVAKSVSGAVAATGGSDLMTRAGGMWLGRVWEAKGAYSTVGARFDDQMGFVQRRGIAKAEGGLGVHWRPAAASRWLRELFPHWTAINVTRDHRAFDSRYADYHVQANFKNSTVIDTGLSTSTEDLADPFSINARRRVVVPRGRYAFGEYFASMTTNTSLPLAWNVRASIGDFYDGRRTAEQVSATLRASRHVNVSTTVNRSRIELPAGAFTTYLVTSRVNVGFTTRMFLNALLQYNTDARQWSSNVRFNVIHHPLSDFFLVYNERRDSRSGALVDRAVIAKITHLVAF